MGIAVSAMHYTGMAAVRVLVDPGAPPPSGATAMDFIFPLTVGLGSYLFLTAAYVGLSDTGRTTAMAVPDIPAPAPTAAPVAARRPLADNTVLAAAPVMNRPFAEGPGR
jgi:hypothetical protein